MTSSMNERELDLILVGRAGVDLYSLDYGRTIGESSRFAKYVGGTAANVAVGAARLGLKVALVTRVGDDDLGGYVRGYLEHEGVDVSHVSKDGKGRTGIVFAEITPGRDGKFIFYREKAADLLVQPDDVPLDLVKRSRALLVTGTGLSANPSVRTVNRAMKLARAHGVTTVLNLDWRPTLWALPKRERVARYGRVISQSDITIGNEAEYVAATGVDDVRKAVGSVRKAKGKTVVVTKGENGSTVYSGGREIEAPGFRVEHLKGLGGGDGFIAGFMYGTLKGWDLRRAAEFGNAVGAIVVTGHACSESMPKLRQVLEFLSRGGA
jgi:5-dehydro-2-deoxygluconokinase